jgi:hypothetical protein
MKAMFLQELERDDRDALVGHSLVESRERITTLIRLLNGYSDQPLMTGTSSCGSAGTFSRVEPSVTRLVRAIPCNPSLILWTGDTFKRVVREGFVRHNILNIIRS